MSGLASEGSGSGAAHRNAGTLRLADGLAFAASPVFAVMALLTHVLGEGPSDMLCTAGQAFPLGGMVPMYLLMSAFHSSPWLKLISGRLVRAKCRA